MFEETVIRKIGIVNRWHHTLHQQKIDSTDTVLLLKFSRSIRYYIGTSVHPYYIVGVNSNSEGPTYYRNKEQPPNNRGSAQTAFQRSNNHIKIDDILYTKINVTRPMKTGYVVTNYTPSHYMSYLSIGTEYLYSVTCIIKPIKCVATKS